MNELLTVFWDYLVLSSPFLLLGFFIAGCIHVWIPISLVTQFLKQNRWGAIFYASLIGVPIPLCSCSVIPTSITLRKAGASNGATSSFLITTPESGVDSIGMTYSLMDLPMTIIRPVAAFASGILAGALNNLFNDYELEVEAENKTCCHSSKDKSSTIKEIFKFGYIKLLDDISGWLFMGLLLGALLNLYFPEDFFTNYSPETSKFLIVLLAVPLYICASATTPIAVSLLAKGASPGAILILLLLGPATNLSNLLVLQKYLGKKGIILNLLAIISVSISAAYFVDYAYAKWWGGKVDFKALASHSHDHPIYYQACAVIFSLLLLNSLIKLYIKPRINKVLKGN
jgi:uncharacterized membrane protein YraQ (UPF0718 family)